jgi:hypothetical protein
MESDFPVSGFEMAFALGFLLGLVETLLLWRWHRGYFQSGLRVFSREVRDHNAGSHKLDPHALDAEFNSKRTNPLIFKSLEEDEIAFREGMKIFEFRMFRFRYSPIMHGLIVKDRYGGQVRVEGRLNWFTIWVPVILVYSPSRCLALFTLFSDTDLAK